MSRRSNPASSGLVIILVFVVALAIIAYFTRTTPTPSPATAGPTTAPAQPLAAAPPASEVPAAASPAKSDVPALVTSTPALPVAREAAESRDPVRTPTTAPAARKPDWAELVPADTGGRVASASPESADPTRRVETSGALADRQRFNAALLSGTLNPAEVAATKAKLAELNAVIVFSTKRFADDPFGGTYLVQNGDSLQKIAKSHGVTWELLGRLNDISDPRKLRAGRAIKIINGPFHAVVSKSRFEMDIWLNEPFSADAMYITTFKVGLGKEGNTPTGTWVVTQGGKQKNPKFWGAGDLPPMEADDPQNPLGEFWLALTGLEGDAEGRESYGIHGTIDPASIGTNASLGCIRLNSPDIAMVYELLTDGKSKVYVKD